MEGTFAFELFAPFEAAPSGVTQDEESGWMAASNLLMLRCSAKRSLEAGKRLTRSGTES